LSPPPEHPLRKKKHCKKRTSYSWALKEQRKKKPHSKTVIELGMPFSFLLTRKEVMRRTLTSGMLGCIKLRLH